MAAPCRDKRALALDHTRVRLSLPQRAVVAQDFEQCNGMATRTACPKSSAVSGLYGRLSIALVRANASALLSRSSSF